MTKKKKIYRTMVLLTVLSDYPLPEGMSLEELDANCADGDFTGKTDFQEVNREFEGQDAADAVFKIGSSPDFFQMDENGNELLDYQEDCDN